MIKFLIIEDDGSARVLLKTILKKNFACTVTEAENGETALHILKSELPSIILLDISMPVMGGDQLLGILRTNPLYRSIPVMVISALSDKDIAGSLMGKGIRDYLLKPIDATETVKRINKVIVKRLGGSTTSSVDGLNKENVGAPRLLFVETDNKSRELFHKLVGDKFIIQDAKNGTETISIFPKFSPRYIIVSDNVGLLDKRIITQKIREAASEDEVSIFLMVFDIKAVSLKVFVFDDVIIKTDNNEAFKNEILKKVLGN
ncbi:MAG: Serine phosphatase RsbU [Ignavibacteria bacterium]|nr:MAG: Serine phosphatase RsbU [Ignavibacteria bacterium]KAF0160731.1 MAG: Serine phosphatase RsbU [Ignavibacteria bacterium]